MCTSHILHHIPEPGVSLLCYLFLFYLQKKNADTNYESPTHVLTKVEYILFDLNMIFHQHINKTPPSASGYTACVAVTLYKFRSEL